MDLSSADKARGAPIRSGSHGPGGAEVAPIDAVQPNRQSNRSRGDRDTGSGRGHGDDGHGNIHGSGTMAPAEAPHTATPHPSPNPGPPALFLQAIDPRTGQVYWQAPLPADPIPGTAYAPPGPREQPAAGRNEKAQSSEMMANRAYAHHDDDDDRPKVVRTA